MVAETIIRDRTDGIFLIVFDTPAATETGGLLAEADSDRFS
jgi:hypothetical protein